MKNNININTNTTEEKESCEDDFNSPFIKQRIIHNISTIFRNCNIIDLLHPRECIIANNEGLFFDTLTDIYIYTTIPFLRKLLQFIHHIININTDDNTFHILFQFTAIINYHEIKIIVIEQSYTISDIIVHKIHQTYFDGISVYNTMLRKTQSIQKHLDKYKQREIEIASIIQSFSDSTTIIASSPKMYLLRRFISYIETEHNKIIIIKTIFQCTSNLIHHTIKTIYHYTHKQIILCICNDYEIVRYSQQYQSKYCAMYILYNLSIMSFDNITHIKINKNDLKKILRFKIGSGVVLDYLKENKMNIVFIDYRSGSDPYIIPVHKSQLLKLLYDCESFKMLNSYVQFTNIAISLSSLRYILLHPKQRIYLISEIQRKYSSIDEIHVLCNLSEYLKGAATVYDLSLIHI